MAYSDKPSILIVLFLISFNAGGQLLIDSGGADYLGIDTEFGDTSEIDTAQSQSQFQTGTGRGSTLFGTYNRLASFFNTIFNALMPGARLLKNAVGHSGFSMLIDFVFTMLALVPVIDAALFLRRG